MASLAFALPSISPWLEMGAYEALWARSGTSFKSLAEMFSASPGAVPSDFVLPEVAEIAATSVTEIFKKARIREFGIRINGAGEYPESLRVAKHPVELIYYQGWWDLAFTASVAVVGTRNPSADGIARAAKLVRHLVDDDFTVVSGLATGIDTIAHKTAIDRKGRTIAVIGTPISSSYPAANRELQDLIARDYLLISQVPVLRYAQQTPQFNRLFFPERNRTMSAITQATIIVEAGETSGTLTQAEAALYQNRKLFILDSCFNNPTLTWPSRFEKRGAIRVREYEDIRQHLVTQVHQD